MPSANDPDAGGHAFSVERLIRSAREHRLDERFGEAERELALACELPRTRDQMRIVDAERARLLYYLGNFSKGLRLATEVLAAGAHDLANSRACLAASANLMALNRAHEALVMVSQAQLGFRLGRAKADDLADALIQSAHVHANMGSHRTATEAARAAVRVSAGSLDGERLRGRALCALGFTLSYAGNDEALEVFLHAERIERARASSLWHWTQFCVATFLRDRGYLPAATGWLERSGVSIRHERAWFAIRMGDAHGAGMWLRPPIRSDERPFARAALAALRLLHARSGGARAALQASREFSELGMHHWSWGSRWIAACDPELTIIRRRTLVDEVIHELGERGAMHWGFFDATSAMRLLAERTRGDRMERQLLAHLTEWSTPARYQESVLVGALSLLKSDALSELSDLDLTPSEVRTLLCALELWIETGDASRKTIAERIGVRESTVRSAVNDIRGKLGVRGRRGVIPLIAWLAERDLLAPATATRVVSRLTR